MRGTYIFDSCTLVFSDSSEGGLVIAEGTALGRLHLTLITKRWSPILALVVCALSALVLTVESGTR
jgi:hypothetical protein